MEILKDLITIKQLPVVEEQFKTIGTEAKKKIEMALSLPCTEDTRKEVKAMRTEIRNEFTMLEDARKSVDRAVDEKLKPFHDAYKQYISDIYKDADTKLKTKVDAVEDDIKAKTIEVIKAYYNELAEVNNCNAITFEQLGINVTLSTTEPALKKAVDKRVEQIVKDYAVIDSSDDSAEIAVEYSKSLDLASALTIVKARHMEIEAQQNNMNNKTSIQQEQKETINKVEEVLSAPVPVETQQEVLTLHFTVKGTVDKLRELKKFLNDGGYDYE